MWPALHRASFVLASDYIFSFLRYLFTLAGDERPEQACLFSCPVKVTQNSFIALIIVDRNLTETQTPTIIIIRKTKSLNVHIFLAIFLDLQLICFHHSILRPRLSMYATDCYDRSHIRMSWLPIASYGWSAPPDSGQSRTKRGSAVYNTAPPSEEHLN